MHSLCNVKIALHSWSHDFDAKIPWNQSYFSEMTLRVVFTRYFLVMMHYYAKFSCSNITISTNFREINSQYVWLDSLTEFLQKNPLGHMSRNCWNSLSHFYRKNFVKALVFQNSWFDEIVFSEREFLVFPHSPPYSY